MSVRPRFLFSLLGAAALALALMPAARPAHAAQFTVTRTDDPAPDGCKPDDCSLREAIIAANAAPGPDRIRLLHRTYKLSRAGRGEDAAQSGDLDLEGELSIEGLEEKVEVDANGIDRVFDVRPGARVKLARVTVSGGEVVGGQPDDDKRGGGIVVRAGAALELDQAVVTANRAVGGALSEGGGIAALGTLTLKASTVSANKSFGDGAGMFVGPDAVATIDNSTIRNNEGVTDESTDGGGILSEGTLTITNSTIRDNKADFDGGGIHVREGTATLNNVTIRDNAVDPRRNGHRGGGGIAVRALEAKLIVNGGTIHGNTASGHGGGVYVVLVFGTITPKAGQVQLSNVGLTNNVAGSNREGGGDGGGLFVPADQAISISGVNTGVSRNTDRGGEFNNCFPANVIPGCAP
jgi:CSLREA domain-containing protein